MIALLGILPALALDLRGAVYTRGSRDPIEGAFVRVDGAPGAPEAQTGPDGSFLLDLPEGTWSLLIGDAEHELQTVSVVVPSPGPVLVYLVPARTDEIVVEARRPSPHVARQVLDRERVEETPGTYGDPIRLVQSLPGAAQTREYAPGAGDVVLRGAAPGESRFYLDGVELPYLYHFQNYASVIHTRLLDELAIYPSTFGPSFGDAVGGIVDVKSRPADTEAVHGGVGISLITGGAYASAPVGEHHAVTASARRSFADLTPQPDTQYTVWPAFWDYLARADSAPGTDHQRALTVLGAGDRYSRYVGDTAVLDPLAAASSPEFAYTRGWHAAIVQSHDTAARARLDTSVAVVYDRWQGEVVGEIQDRAERTLQLRHEATLFQTEHYALAVGLEGRQVRLSRQATPGEAWVELEDEAPLLARGVPVDEVLHTWRGGVWLDPRFHLGPVLTQPGVRLQADSASGTVSVDPRLTLQAQLREDLRLRAGAGRATQAPELDALSPITGDPDLPLASSWSANVGLDSVIAGRLELGLDGWGRTFSDVLVQQPGEVPTTEDGAAWGVELSSRYRLREVFFFAGWLSLGHAERGGAPFDYDQPYAVSLLGSWDINPRWNLGLRFRRAAGLPYTPVAGSVYDGDTNDYAPVLGDENSVRMPDYQKIDAHIERRIALRRVTLVGYAELWWVPAEANVLYPAWSYDYSEEAYVGGPGFLPLVGARADF